MAVEQDPAEANPPVPTGIELTPLDSTYREDPYPVLEKLRGLEPVHRDEMMRGWMLTRHDDVVALLNDRTAMSDPRKLAEDSYLRQAMLEAGDGDPSMLFADPPDHTRLRALVSKAFTPRAVEKMRPRIEQVVNELLDAVTDGDGFDLIGDFSGPLPTVVIAEMLGVDPADRDDFKRWSDEGVMAFNPLLSEEEKARVAAAGEKMDAYFRRVIAERRAAPRDDLLSGLIAAEDAGEQLTDDEIVTMCSLLLVAGNVTTTDLIGNGVLALLRNRDELKELQNDPSLVKNAVEEMLRFDSPVVQSGRIQMSDAEIGGCPISARQSVGTSLGAANRDPDVYPEPNRFDITREDTHHQSFGGGIHYCLGAPLARLEPQIAVGALVVRFPDLRLADGPLEWRTVPGFRGLTKLPVLI